MTYFFKNRISRVEASEIAENSWTEHVHESVSRLLMSKTDSWFMGVNKNIVGREEKNFMLYAGGFPGYTQRCNDIASNGYERFNLS